MKTLSSTLLAHQKGAIRIPAVSVVARDERFGMPILRWTRWYTGIEADAPHAACVLANGSLFRVRNDAGTVRYQLVTNPASGSVYSTWTSLGAVAVAGSGVCCATDGTNLSFVYVRTGGLRMRYYRSTDSGATFSANADVIAVDETATISWCAMAAKAGGGTNAFRLFWNRGASDLRRSTSTAGATWSAATTHSLVANVASFSGMGACWDDDYQLIVTALEATSNDLVVLGYVLGDGGRVASGTLAGPVEIQRADAGSGITALKSPSCGSYGDTVIATWSEKETANVAYTRTYAATSEKGIACEGYFSEPYPLESQSAFGPCITTYAGLTSWFLCETAGVWNAATAASSSDLSSRVMSLSATLTERSALLLLTLENHDAAVTPSLPSVVFPGLAVGGAIVVQPGYGSAPGQAAEYGVTFCYQVERIDLVRDRQGRSVAEIRAGGVWERAHATQARQALSVAAGVAGNRALLFRRALSRAGGVRIRPGTGGRAPSADWTTDHAPGLMVQPGAAWAGVADDLLEAEAESLYYDGYDVFVRSMNTGDSSDYTYSNSGDHPLRELAVTLTGPGVSWFRAVGPDRYTDAYSQADIDSFGPRLERRREYDGGTNLKVGEYAAAGVARGRWGRQRGILTVPWNAGQELGDVVTVSDALVGIAATNYRVLAIHCEYDRVRARYDAILTLGAL